MPTKIEKDTISGQDTTGHEWDGVKELNTPLPTWWVYTFWATIVFAAVYCVLYPSWPWVNTHTLGLLGYTNRAALSSELAAQSKARSVFVDRIRTASFEQIRKDPELFNFALAGGRSAFQTNCMQCHGAGGAGSKGFPNLADDDWLWGGSIDQIYQTVQHGIRNTDEKSRQTVMPRFGVDGILTPAQVGAVTDYVMSLSGRGKANAEGAKIFAEQCVSCHKAVLEPAPRRGDAEDAGALCLHAGRRALAVRAWPWMAALLPFMPPG